MAATPRPTLAHRIVARLVRVLLFLYPARFRREVQDDFHAAATHRLSSELIAAGSPVGAVWRTARLLLADTLRSAPGIWRSHIAPLPHRPIARLPLWPIASLPHWPIASLAYWLIDVRLALRAYSRQPLFALMVVGTLGLGIGASAAAFSTLSRVVLRPLPFPDGERMAFVSLQDAKLGWRFTPTADLVTRWRANARTVEQFEVFRLTSATYLDGPAPEVIDAAGVSAGLPAMLSLRPVTGRALGPADLAPGAPLVVMVSEKWWRSQLGGVEDLAGRSLRLGDLTYAVVGVWPTGARVAPRGQPDILFIDSEQTSLQRGGQAFVIARLAHGVDPSGAEADLAAHMAGVKDVPDDTRPSIASPASFLGKEYVQGLWMVFAASVLLMAVAVANAASLLIARASSRSREIGVRRALGGSAWRLTRMFIVESALLSTVGGVLAVVVAWATGRLLGTLASTRIPASHLAGLDGAVLWFAAGGAALAVAICALVPLVHLRTSDASPVTGAGNDLRVMAGTSRLRQLLVGLQAAIGIVLLAGAVLMSRSIGNIASVDVGFAVNELATLSLSPPASRYPTPESRAAFLATARDTLLAIPGVTGVVNSGSPLFRMSLASGQLYLDGETPAAGAGQISTTGAPPGYFDVLGIPLRQGRLFEPGDAAGVVIVNESFARSRGGQVVGRLLFLSRPGAPQPESKPTRIVGVVGDVLSGALSASGDGAPGVQVYSPSTGAFSGFARFLIRTSTDPASVLATARRRISELDPQLPLVQVDTAVNLFRADTAQHRFVAVLLGSLASLGVLLGVAGVYGAVSIEVRRRRREVGLRLALGATGPQVVRLLVHTGMRPVLLGVGVGTVAWWGTSSWLDPMLYRIQARDPVSALVALGALCLVAVAACLVAARHASRVDPAVTLRAN